MNYRKIDKRFFERDARIVAKELIGKILVKKTKNRVLKARIVETEAYFGPEDPASRAKQNGDLKKTMEMGPGTMLVYGVHNNWLMNIVTNDEGKAEAVLFRALEPLNFRKNCKGPGLLTKSLNINKSFHKKNIFKIKGFEIINPKKEQKFEVVESFRIGVKKDLPEKLRFYIKNNKYFSKK